MSGLDNDMELPQPPEPYKAMTEQPDWAVRAADALSVTGLLARYDECQCDSPEEVEAKAAAIIRANSPDVWKMREALEKAKPIVGFMAARNPQVAESQIAYEMIASALASVPQPTPAFTSDEDGTALAYAAESIPAETLTDELAAALTMCAEEVRLNDGSALLYREAQSVLQRYNATKPKP